MMRCSPLLLMICLTCRVGLPLFAQGDPGTHGRIVIEEEHTRTTGRIQPPTAAGNRGKPQEAGSVPDGTEIQDTTRLHRSLQGMGNSTERKDTTRTQQLPGEVQNGKESTEKTKIKLTGNRLIIEHLPEDGILEIYNIMGAKVYNRRIKAGTNQYILSLPKGYYIIKTGKLTRKIAIK